MVWIVVSDIKSCLLSAAACCSGFWFNTRNARPSPVGQRCACKTAHLPRRTYPKRRLPTGIHIGSQDYREVPFANHRPFKSTKNPGHKLFVHHNSTMPGSASQPCSQRKNSAPWQTKTGSRPAARQGLVCMAGYWSSGAEKRYFFTPSQKPELPAPHAGHPRTAVLRSGSPPPPGCRRGHCASAHPAG